MGPDGVDVGLRLQSHSTASSARGRLLGPPSVHSLDAARRVEGGYLQAAMSLVRSLSHVRAMFGVGAERGSAGHTVGWIRRVRALLGLTLLLGAISVALPSWVSSHFNFSMPQLEGRGLLATGGAAACPLCDGSVLGRRLQITDDSPDALQSLRFDIGVQGYHEQRSISPVEAGQDNVVADCYFDLKVGVTVLNQQIDFYNAFIAQGGQQLKALDEPKIEASYGLMATVLAFVVVALTQIELTLGGLLPGRWLISLRALLPLTSLFGVAGVANFAAAKIPDSVCPLLDMFSVFACGYSHAYNVAIATVVLLVLSSVAVFFMPVADVDLVAYFRAWYAGAGGDASVSASSEESHGLRQTDGGAALSPSPAAAASDAARTSYSSL